MVDWGMPQILAALILVVHPVKPLYDPHEPLKVEVRLQNASDRTYTFLEFFSDGLMGTYMFDFSLRGIEPARKIEMVRPHAVAKKAHRSEPVTLLPGQGWKREINLRAWFQDSKFALSSGTYEVVAMWDDSQSYPLEGKHPPAGLKSLPVQFRVMSKNSTK